LGYDSSNEAHMHRQSSRENLVRLLAGCVTLLVALPLAAKQTKPAGEISDKKAFQNVQRYCIDLNALKDYEAYDAKGFIERESRPGKLLTKIPWRLEKDCDDSDLDAVVKLEFPRSLVVRLGSGPTPVGPGIDGRPSAVAVGGQDHTRAVLRVISRQNNGTIYQCEADPLSSGGGDSGPVTAADATQRYDAMYRAFGFLAHHIKRVSP
jgi:hypothetical protein